MSPGVSSRAHWATIEAQVKCIAPSTIHLSFDLGARRFSGTTENVARLALDMARAIPQGKAPIDVELDGQILRGIAPPIDRSSRQAWFTRKGSAWSVALEPPSPLLKGPHRHGPFKEVFRHRFVLVYGTRGRSDENEWSMARARYDAELFWYRGNGSVDCVADTDFINPARKAEFQDRSVIVYGHAESNAVWPLLLAKSPVQVERGKVRIGSPHTLGRRPGLHLSSPSSR